MVAPKPRARTLAKSGAAAVPRSGRIADSRDDAWVNSGRHGEKLSVFEFPTFMIERLSGLVKRSFMPSYIEPFGIGIPEWRVLVAIASRSALTFNEICGVLTMDRAQVSRTLGTLLEKSLVTQVTTARSGHRGRGHGRTQTRMTLTADGARIYKRLMPIAQQRQMILLSALDEHERSIVYNALWKLIAAAGQFETRRSAKPSQSKRSSASAKRAKSRPEDSNSSRGLHARSVASPGNAGP